MIAFGYGTLRLEPDAFWALTPRELAAAIRALGGQPRGGGALPRAAFEALMREHPDEESGYGQR